MLSDSPLVHKLRARAAAAVGLAPQHAEPPQLVPFAGDAHGGRMVGLKGPIVCTPGTLQSGTVALLIFRIFGPKTFFSKQKQQKTLRK